MINKVITFCFAVLLLGSLTVADELKQHPQTNVCKDWRLGVQTWSFNRFTLFEAIDKTRSLGLDYIQAYPGQTVSNELAVQFNEHLSQEHKAAVKAKLEDAGISIFAYGVTGIPKDEAGARKLFEFAKEMGIETLASEPGFDQYDLIDKLCQEYEIKLAVHNHPAPSKYWNPDTVVKAYQGRSKWIGACTDVGHWVRSGLDPVECLKKLEGRIHDVHIKEIEDNHDVIWGTGQGRIKGILEELHRQGYKGTFSIEYEYNWENNVPEIRQSVDYFNSVAKTFNPTDWANMVESDLSNVDVPGGNWTFENGELVLNPLKKNSDLWTKAQYENFILDLEYKLDKGANSGVFIRAGDHNWLPWIEVQVLDSYGKPADKHSVGGIYDIIAPTVNAVKPVGEWNRMTVIADGSLVCVILNGMLVVNMNLDDWTEAGKNPDGTNNKFNVAYKDLPRSGFIGLQDHGDKVWYRNIKIKEL